jgi:ABC-type lipoprotein export system ATPase subunit
MLESTEPILEANALYHIYDSKAEDGNVIALRGLHVKVKPGEAVAVVGPSGSGKSTLLKCLGGLMKPSSGIVSLDGSNMTRLTGKELVELRQRTVSFIFQEGNLLPDISALDNVAQPLRHQKVPSREAKRRAQELLDELGMGHRSEGLPSMLSGGEQQRVAIARALITNPRLILADEPTGALDPITSREVLALFKELHETKGVAFLMVTHSAEVASFCDRSLELRDGRFIAQHGADFEVTDLAESRELIVDDIGTMVLSPDLLIEMGGAGRYEVEEVGDGRLVLVSTEENESLLVGGKTLAPSCPACFHTYTDEDTQLCPECGSSRPMVQA